MGQITVFDPKIHENHEPESHEIPGGHIVPVEFPDPPTSSGISAISTISTISTSPSSNHSPTLLLLAYRVLVLLLLLTILLVLLGRGIHAQPGVGGGGIQLNPPYQGFSCTIAGCFFINPVNSCVSASGSGVAYTCPSVIAKTCLANIEVLWTPDVTSGANPTLDVGCGAKAIKTNENAAPASALFAAGISQRLRYDGTALRAPAMVNTASGASATGNVSISTAVLPAGMPISPLAYTGTDPTGATDSTAGIQAAVNAAATSRRRVYIPAGTYKHTGLTINPGVRVLCDTGTTLDYTPATGNAITFPANSNSAELRGCTLQTSGNSTGYAIYANAATQRSLVLADLEVSGFLGGIWVADALNVVIDNVRLNGTGKAVVGGVGLQVGYSGHGGNAVTVTAAYINNYEKCIIQWASSAEYIRPTIEACGTGYEGHTRAVVTTPWVGSNTTNFYLYVGTLIMGYLSQASTVSYDDPLFAARTVILPESFDGGPLKLGLISVDTNGSLIYGAGTEGVCDASNRGRTVMVQAATGTKDTLRVCAKDAADIYAWRTIY